jgi:hypothetical protein
MAYHPAGHLLQEREDHPLRAERFRVEARDVAGQESQAAGQVERGEHRLGLAGLQVADQCAGLADEQDDDEERRQDQQQGDADQHQGRCQVGAPAQTYQEALVARIGQDDEDRPDHDGGEERPEDQKGGREHQEREQPKGNEAGEPPLARRRNGFRWLSLSVQHGSQACGFQRRKGR